MVMAFIGVQRQGTPVSRSSLVQSHTTKKGIGDGEELVISRVWRVRTGAVECGAAQGELLAHYALSLNGVR